MQLEFNMLTEFDKWVSNTLLTCYDMLWHVGLMSGQLVQASGGGNFRAPGHGVQNSKQSGWQTNILRSLTVTLTVTLTEYILQLLFHVFYVCRFHCALQRRDVFGRTDPKNVPGWSG